MWSRAPQSMAFGPTSPGSLLELQTLSSMPEPPDRNLWVWCQESVLTSSPGDSSACCNSKNTGEDSLARRLMENVSRLRGVGSGRLSWQRGAHKDFGCLLDPIVRCDKVHSWEICPRTCPSMSPVHTVLQSIQIPNSEVNIDG